ncbi:SRPBCC domain-containing protein [Phycicoccus sonneratiae]|uniref:SRPBCC domain-containing protein n=1 Tax=Phycicoccus sonneratiae TaxID=2807628 RepID=A0ABS2CGH4_9MICO|nr:SRPBCC domain-containing protein [Phycicoccus sonneraticus]MBM6398961.1 SRPBCC domain-containing protein [Phycicoccus sonneraticus]
MTTSTTTGTLRALDDTRGAVRVEDVYATDVADLWEACTTPERLARWLAHVEGDLREGGSVRATFTSTWTGELRVEVCEAQTHLLLAGAPGTDEATEIELWITPEGEGARLVVEERGLALAALPFHGSGWQAHLEDLGASLRTGTTVHPDGWSAEAPATGWKARWEELTPSYRDRADS